MRTAAQRARFDAIEMLDADHARIKSLFRDHARSRSEARAGIVEQIFNELELHMMVTERIFYPSLASRSRIEGLELFDGARVQHSEIKELIAELRTLDPLSHPHEVRLRSLREDVEHHIRQEEEEMLPLAERVLSVASESLGEEMMEMKLLGRPDSR